MTRFLAIPAALLLLVAAWPSQAANCAPGYVKLRHGGCAKGSVSPAPQTPSTSYCYGRVERDALGRCPPLPCPGGYGQDRYGHCQPGFGRGPLRPATPTLGYPPGGPSLTPPTAVPLPRPPAPVAPDLSRTAPFVPTPFPPPPAPGLPH
jgi:hypothetical protein